MLTVALVYRTGGDFDASDVTKLYSQIKANLTIGHRVVCLTNDNLPGQLVRDGFIPLKHNWPGWWSKMELFAIPGPVLYFDLDTVITGNIDDLANAIISSKDQFFGLRDFYQQYEINSGIMGWNCDMAWLYEEFLILMANGGEWIDCGDITSLKGLDRKYRGDQDYIAASVRGQSKISPLIVQDIFPGIYSYKVDILGRKVPDDAKIICFHGKPRPKEVNLKNLFVGNKETT